MAVLVNLLSASASEIFAGAVQDYGRGLLSALNDLEKGPFKHFSQSTRVS